MQSKYRFQCGFCPCLRDLRKSTVTPEKSLSYTRTASVTLIKRAEEVSQLTFTNLIIAGGKTNMEMIALHIQV